MVTLDNFSVINIKTLAGYVLKNYGPMSHLKLQKLLYYIQSYHLAYFKKELFEEDFEAWVHGPVSRSIFDSLRGKSILYSDVTYNEYDFDASNNLKDIVSIDQFDLINNVLSNLNSWSGIELENATHNESPWLIARGSCSPNESCSTIINKRDMMDFYSKELNAQV
jgi:uncharacterized phage-associated protein